MVLESNTLDVLFVKDGQQGEDGKVLYTWIKYAKDANGTGMTDDPNGAIYIGISYNNESSIESNDPTQYAWTKIQGADGKKGEDAYTIFLENENISFATDKNRNPLSEQAYTSGITIMKGAKPVTDFIIGDIAKTQGIAVAKTDTAIAISVINGNPLPSDSGEIEIPITVGGTVFKKILTWTCAKKGDQGEQGERGLQGIQGPQGIQGVAGKDGTNGKTTYFHIKYSSVANPTSSSQLTETPSTYIGTYVDFTETDSTDPKKYTWSQFVGSQGPKGEQGIAGVGVDGKTSYLHIAYANSADGKTGFSTSDSTNKSYIGQYTDFTPNDSTDYTKYSWSLIRGKDGTDGVSPTVSVTKNGKTTTITITDKNGTHTQTVKDGTDGTPGQTGKDGKTTYFHVKYSNDGGQTFTSNSGEDTGIYMGSYTDYTEADSTDVKKYNWVKVSGDNFSWNLLTKDDCNMSKWTNTMTSWIKVTNNEYNNIISYTTLSGGWEIIYKKIAVEKGKKYVLSFDYKVNKAYNYLSGQKYGVYLSTSVPTNIAPTNIITNGQYVIENTVTSIKRGMITFSAPADTLYIVINGGCINDNQTGLSFEFNKWKLENGTIASPWAPHKDDLQGRGVSQTVQYYLATSQASGVTSSTSGWSTDITTQKLTVDKKYLWNCYQTKYSDGTSEPISTPKVIGVYGDKGNGIVASVQRPNKTEFWWSQVGAVGHKDTFDDSSNTRNNCRVGDIFTVMGTSTEGNSHTVYYKSTTDSGDLAGECINHVIAESGADAKNLSITPSSQYFKSTDGGKTFAPNTITIKPTIQGEISFGKWQYSIDGGVSFADVVSGQKGLTINNNVLTVSKDSSLYSDSVTMVTFRAVANNSSFYDTCSIAKIYDVSDIGDGRNLLWNSNFAKTDEAITGTTNSWGLHTRGTNLVASIDTSTKHNGFNTLKTVSAANGDKNSSNDLEWFAWGISERTSDNLHSKSQNYTLSFYAKASVTTDFIVRWGYDAYGVDTTRTLTTNWQKYEIKLHQATSAYSITIIFKLLTAGTVWFSEFKLEKGSSATGYSTAPEDFQTAILSTKSEISDVSLKVDKNKQAIEQRVEKTTYQQDLNLVKGDISKANEGLNKWRYEIYPKSLFASEYQGKSTMDVFAKNTNLTPSQSVLINDTDFGKSWAYGDNYIGYALTFVKFSAAKSIAITFKHDDGAHLYLNGKLIGGDDRCNTGSGESLTLSFIQGWNCLEVVLNEKSGSEYIGLGTTISAISECQLMNCYYGTPVARQSHITNQLVQNTTDIDGVSTKVSKVTSVIGDNGENFTSFKNDYSDFKQTMNGFKTTVGQTYVTKDDFNGLEIGGRNLVRLGGLSSNGATSFSYDKTTDIYTIVSPVVSTVRGIGAAVKYDDNHKVLIPYGKTYILSFEVKVPQALSINIDINNFAVSGSSWAGNDNDDGSMRGQSSYNIPANTWTKVWVRWANTNTKNTNKVDLYDNSSIGLVTKDCTSAITWQIRHVKGELGNKPTDWTPAPEDVNGKIVNVETIANQTAKKFEWIVKGGDSSSNFTLTDRVADLVAERINFKGLVTFSGLNTDAKNEIGKVAQSKVDGLEIGGRNLIINSNLSRTLTNVTNDGCSNMTVVSDSVYGHALKFTAVNQRRVFWATSNVWVKNKTYTVSFVAKSSVTGQKIRPSRSTADWGDDITLTTSYARYTTKITSLDTNAGGTLSFSCTNAVGDITITNVKLEVGNKATDWTPAPEDVSQDATNKASQALTDAKNYSSNAVNWVTNNGSSTTSLNSMVKKWTDGAVSDTAQINGGWIKANTITASKIALADFTNYSQLTRDTADAYGFTVTDDTDGTWFSTKNIKRDQFISEIFPCNGGESYLIEYDISTNAKGANNSTDTKNYIGVAIGVYGYTGTVGSNGLPNKATNIWYADRITGSETAPSIHVKTTITTSTATKQFRVFLQSNGYYFEGTTKIRNLSVRRMYGGTLIVDGSITADKIATDAIKSRNYISSGGTQGSFLNLSDGSFQSPNLSWDSNGNLIAKNANLSGEITATKGKIGKYTITDQWLITGSGSTASGFGGNQAFWAGSSSSNDAPFRVGYNGKLYANGATISGDITATTGKIGDLTLKDGILTGTGSYSEPYTEDDDGTVTSTITTNYITKLFGKGLTIDSTVKYSDEDDVYSYKVSVLPDEISFTDGEEIGMLGAGGLQILQVNDNSDSYSSEANEVSLSSGASNFYYTTPVNQTTDKYLHVCFSADGASFMASQGDKFNSFDIGYSSAKYSGNFAANKFVYTGNSLNYVECLESNDTTNFYFHSSGYYSFRVNNKGNWSDETQSVYITGHGVSVPGQIGLYSQEMSNYVARYYVAGSTKSTAIGNNSYQTRIYGSSVWANKAVSTSDVRLKQDFQSLDKFEDLYMQLQPVSFKYIDGYDKSEDRYFGLKAQPTEQLFEDMGENPDDYAMFNKFGIDHEDIKERIGYDVDFDEEHGLDYTNLITLNTHMVQKTRRELAELQKENAELKDMLKAIVKKINM